MAVKMSVVYYSQTGNTEQMAQAIVKGANKIEGVDCKAFSIENIDDDFVKESKCMIFGTPAYLATMNIQARTWLETQAGKYNTLGKLGGAFLTTSKDMGWHPIEKPLRDNCLMVIETVSKFV